MPASATVVPPGGASDGGRLARWLRRLRSRRVEVVERSMEPTLFPGDRLLVERHPYRNEPLARDHIVVVEDPERARRYLVKRVVALEGEIPPDATARVPPGHVWLAGDWQTVSRDSRNFGAVSTERIWGRVWYRYYPAENAGPIGGVAFVPS
ncbi:MAG: S26 family signal peptidase [Thermoplasmata archaeon]|nr:S26 family signal peptidase [Thermoplasmata archaeon]